jgi:hypothetical protein
MALERVQGAPSAVAQRNLGSRDQQMLSRTAPWVAAGLISRQAP